MPMRLPAKVRISPKAARTEGCISPVGGRKRATVMSAKPKRAIA